MGKYYAVRVGRRPGIYESWDEVKPLVNGFAGAQHKSFKTRSGAEAYMSAGPRGPIAGAKRGRDDYGYSESESEDERRYGDTHRQRPASYDPCASNPGGSRPYQPYGRQPAAPLATRQANFQPIVTSGVLIVERPSGPSHHGGSRSAGPTGGSGAAGGRFSAVVDGPFHPIRSDALYQLEFDGAARGNPGEAGCGAVLRHQSDGVVVCRLRKYMGSPFTNNEAEYTALIEGLKMARRLGVTRLEVCGDSKLVVQQVQGKWRINKDHLQALCSQVLAESRQLSYFSIKHVLREYNADADQLSNDAIDLAYRA